MSIAPRGGTAQGLSPRGSALSHTRLEDPLMKVWNLFVAVAVVGLLAGTAVAQVDVKPGGVTVTGPAGGSVQVPFTGQPTTLTQPGTSGTFIPGTTTQTYPGYSTYPWPYYQGVQYPGYTTTTFPGYQVVPYGTSSFYQTPYAANGYSYYQPGQAAPAGGYAMAVAGGCCGAAAPMYTQPIAYGGACCDTHRKRGLFRRR